MDLQTYIKRLQRKQNPMTHQEQIDVIKAAMEGKCVQFRKHGVKVWYGSVAKRANSEADYPFDFQTYEYRVKPEPGEFWVVVFNCEPLAFNRKEAADKFMANAEGYNLNVIHVREVIE